MTNYFIDMNGNDMVEFWYQLSIKEMADDEGLEIDECRIFGKIHIGDLDIFKHFCIEKDVQITKITKKPVASISDTSGGDSLE